MKRYNRLISFLLALAMVFTLAACSKDPTPEATTGTTETAATEPAAPSAADIYNEARKTLDTATELAAELTTTTVTTVQGRSFTDKATHTVTYRDIGKETAAILEEKTVTIGEPEEATVAFTQIWSQGQVYANLDEKYYAQAPLTPEEAVTNFSPVVLLDASLYESITMEETEGTTLITFSQPTAPEAWITDEEMDDLQASGTARIADGVITEMTYTITMDYGVSQVDMTITAKPADPVKEITVPTDTEKYIVTDDVTALYLYGTIAPKLAQAQQLEFKKDEQIFSSASGDYIVGSTAFATYGADKDAIYKLTEDIYMMDVYSEEEQESAYKMNFKNGTITIVEDEGLPTFHSATWDEAYEPLWLLVENMTENLSPDYWKEVTTTFFGNLLLMEFQFNENYSNARHNDLCSFLYGDANALMELSSKYEGKELTGFLSFDAATGFPLSMGYTYEAEHTIDGEIYPLRQEVQVSTVTPSINAYQFINDLTPPAPEPEETATPLFYKVTGANGQQMYLLGSIHVGDVRNEYLPKEIKDAFKESDALAVECDTDAFFEKVETDPALAAQVSAHYYNEGGKSLEEILEEEDYKTLVQLLKATGQYNQNVLYMKPSVAASLLSNIFMDLGYTFSSDYGVEEQLHKWAEEQNKPVREVESVLFQMEMDSHYSKELQILLLQQEFENCPGATWMGIDEMYDLWCAGDEAALREFLAEEVDTSELTEEELAEYEAAKPLMEEYDKAMVTDRNQGMLEVAIEYLESGDVVFYAVGLAHLLDGGNGLVDTLREAGYTVEQVTYAQ